MAHGRSKSLTADEAKQTLVDWARATDARTAARFAGHPWLYVSAAMSAGVVLATVMRPKRRPPPRPPRRRWFIGLGRR